jgi:predicted dehydrogenase
MTNTPPLRFGILGAAAIAPAALVQPARALAEATVVAVAARDPARAQAFARRHAIPRVHRSYDELLADPEIDAIYNPLPNGLHAEWTIRALRAGKHVLCEKPLAANAREVEDMAQAARESGRVLSEAFAYRYHPLAARMQAILAGGEIGAVRHIDARFCFFLPMPGNIRYRYDLAGGATMDAGCYPVSLVRFLAGAEPTVTRAQARLIAPQVDYRMTGDLAFADGRTARVTCDMLSPWMFRSQVVVQGDAGELSVVNPYHPHWFHWLTVQGFRVPAGGRAGRRRERVPGENVYTAQLRAFVQAVRGERALSTGPDDALGNLRVIDALYDAAGLKRRGT